MIISHVFHVVDVESSGKEQNRWILLYFLEFFHAFNRWADDVDVFLCPKIGSH